MIVGLLSPKKLLLALMAVASVSGQTSSPTVSPTPPPTVSPTPPPTVSPTPPPTNNPTVAPSKSPTNNPTMAPSMSPTPAPSSSPTATCMVTLQNGTDYTAEEYAGFTNGAEFNATTSTLTCGSNFLGRGACSNPPIEVMNCGLIECTATDSCKEMRVRSNTALECTASGSCTNARVQAETKDVLCEGASACDGTQIEVSTSNVVSCKNGGCLGADVFLESSSDGSGVRVMCEGSIPTCGGSTNPWKVGNGFIRCSHSGGVSVGSPCVFQTFETDCLECEDYSCGEGCVVETASRTQSCSDASATKYGLCDFIPTASPTISNMPSISAAPTNAGCRVMDKEGKYLSGAEFAQLTPGVSYFREFDTTTHLVCVSATGCNDVTFIDCDMITCGGNSSCYGATSQTSGHTVECTGPYGCLGMTMKSPAFVECEDEYACQNATITGLLRLLMCRSLGGGPNPCHGLSVSSAGYVNVTCLGIDSCTGGMEVTMAQGNVLCAGEVIQLPIESPENPVQGYACSGVDIYSRCLGCFTDGCGGTCSYNNSDSQVDDCSNAENAAFGSCPFSFTSGASIPQVVGFGTVVASILFAVSFVAL